MTSLTLVRRIAARPETVFEAMTSPEGISHWWGPDAGPVLALQLRISAVSESMGNHDSGDHGWPPLRSRRRWISGCLRCGL